MNSNAKASMSKSKLTDKKPRENSGRDVIKRFNYQFRKTAEASLKLLDDKSLERVFCDYQDDYVLKVIEGNEAVFLFHQVKTKKKESEIFGRNDVFGITETKSKNFKKGKGKKSFGGKLFYHHLNFGKSCKSVHIITNALFKDELEKLISDAKSSSDYNKLNGSNNLASRIIEYFQSEFKDATQENIFEFLNKLNLEPSAGKLNPNPGDQEATYLARIYNYTEVSLEQSQADRIAAALYELIRQKSIADIPSDVTENDLNKYASIDFWDVFKILSISKSAFEELKAGGDPKALKSASILQRILKRCNATEEMVVAASKAKVLWDNWIRDHRHTMVEADYFALERKTKRVLDEFVQGNISLDDLNNQLSSINSEFQGKLPAGITLSVNLIFGLFWSIAVKEELF